MLYLGRLLARAQHAQDVKAELDVAAEVGQVTAIEAAATVSGLRGDDRPASGTPAPGSGAPWRGAPPRPERRIRRWSESSLRRTPTPRRPGPRCRSRPPGTASCAPTLANRRRAGAARRRPRRTVPARPWRASVTTFRPPSSMRSGRWANGGRPTSGDGPVSAGRPVDYEALSVRSVARSPHPGARPGARRWVVLATRLVRGRADADSSSAGGLLPTKGGALARQLQVGLLQLLDVDVLEGHDPDVLD